MIRYGTGVRVKDALTRAGGIGMKAYQELSKKELLLLKAELEDAYKEAKGR